MNTDQYQTDVCVFTKNKTCIKQAQHNGNILMQLLLICQNRCAGSPTVDGLRNNPSASSDSSGDCPRHCIFLYRKHYAVCLGCGSMH